MISALELRKGAWLKFRAAQTLFENRDWDNATYVCGYAVEMMLKARITVDHNLPGFPESTAEFQATKLTKFQTHKFEQLLNHTTVAGHVKSNLSDWGLCLQWNPDTRYQAMGTATETTAKELIRAAEAVINAISDKPGLEFAAVAASENPYVKLWGVERELSIERGPFVLFGLWHRADSFPASSDLVVSAKWIDAPSRRGVEHVEAAVQKALDASQITSISGIIALEITHPVVQAACRLVRMNHSPGTEYRNVVYGDVMIDAAMMVTSDLRNA